MFSIKPIGKIRSPYKDVGEAPIQGRLLSETAEIEVFPEFEEGLRDVETCTHLIILYWLHKARRNVLTVKAPHDKAEHGVFATRSPHRPNPIGFSVVELVERRGRILKVKGLDAIDGTPVIDIKPYVSEIDSIENAVVGWLKKAKTKLRD